MLEILETIIFLVFTLLFPLQSEKIEASVATPLLSPTILTATTSSYFVTRVVDGDTFKVASGEALLTVRIIGINTPETKDPRKGVECFGEEASEQLTNRIHEKTVILSSDPSQAERDRYGRLLRYVTLQDGTDVGEELIRNGYAYEYTYNTPYLKQEIYKNAQADAQETQQGLWAPDICP